MFLDSDKNEDNCFEVYDESKNSLYSKLCIGSEKKPSNLSNDADSITYLEFCQVQFFFPLSKK